MKTRKAGGRRVGEKLYGERADLYDLIYARLDYEEMAGRVVEVLAAEGVKDTARVIEAACGTGEYVKQLSSRYRMAGFDLSEEMLAISRRKNPDVTHFPGDMRSFDVEEPFDALVCLFSSIGYASGEDEVRRTAACFARAVRPGGVVVIEPWITAEDFRDGYSSLHTYEDDDVKVARLSYSYARDGHAVMDFEWTVSRTGVGLDRFRETHELWFCPRETMARAMADAGLDARFEPEGLMPERGIWIGRRG